MTVPFLDISSPSLKLKRLSINADYTHGLHQKSETKKKIHKRSYYSHAVSDKNIKRDTCVPSNNIPSTCTRDFKHFDSSVWSPLQFKKYQSEPFNSQDLIINCPLLLLQIFL